jgi:prepilin-type N-terminal cleavage/methylation domain-containing protein
MTLSTLKAKRRGFTLVELLVVIAIIGTLVGLLLPAVQSAREAGRRSSCSNNVRQLGLSVLNYESGRQRLPAFTDRNEWTGQPGVTTSNSGTTPGYSWVVLCLPFMEETGLYNAIASSSGKFANSPFANTTVNVATGTAGTNGALLAASVNIPPLRCASFVGDGKAETNTSGASNGLSYAAAYNALGAGNVSITNYKANVGTHIASGTAVANNGPITYPTTSGTAANASRAGGIPLGSIADGTSKTVMVVETKERGFAGWIDGSTSWVTASNLVTSSTFPNYINGSWRTAASTNVVSAAPGQTGVGINFPATTVSGTGQYLSSTAWTQYATYGMAHGPSSDHAGGLVLHAFVDGHVGQISSDVDPTIYMSLFSRAQGEPISDF